MFNALVIVTGRFLTRLESILIKWLSLLHWRVKYETNEGTMGRLTWQWYLEQSRSGPDLCEKSDINLPMLPWRIETSIWCVIIVQPAGRKGWRRDIIINRKPGHQHHNIFRRISQARQTLVHLCITSNSISKTDQFPGLDKTFVSIIQHRAVDLVSHPAAFSLSLSLLLTSRGNLLDENLSPNEVLIAGWHQT